MPKTPASTSLRRGEPASASLPRGKKEKLAIIDSNALIHRAFHALPPLTNKDGQMTNAVYGFTTILLKTIKDLKPDYLVATFDLAAKTFRHTEYDQYKAHRVKQPDELYAQIPLVKKVLGAFNIPVFEKEGFEADDLIGTVAHLKSVDRPDIETIIVTGDQDTLQLVDDNTKVLSPHKGISETILYDEKLVTEKFEGLKPSQLIDYKALRGDPSDNIPGVRGIGQKGAIDLLNEFGTLENIYKNISSKKIKDRTRELLQRYKSDALLSKKLATIITNVPIDFDLKKCAFTGFNQTKVIEIFQQLNFKKLLGQLSNLENKLIAKGGQGSLFDGAPKIKQTLREKNPHHTYQCLTAAKKIKEFIAALKNQKEFCLDTETTGLDPFKSALLGISFCWQKDSGTYLPINFIDETDQKTLAKIFADPKVKKIGHNLKFDLEVLIKAGLEVNGVYFDTMLASYLLNTASRQHSLDTLAFVELGYQMQLIEELIGKGKDQISLAEVPVDQVACYSCEDAIITWLLYEKFEKELDKQGMLGLFEKIDMPLVSVLAEVEKNGVKIDDEFLKKLSAQFAKKITAIEQETYKIAGEKFNLGSPLQLKKILFEKMKIDGAGLGKTKTGISTAGGELEKLAMWLKENKEDGKKKKIIDLIIEFRELSKLKNTYLDALPELINPHDGRVHTSFNQAITATGRLSSSEPNLQNIPIRTELGQQIRKAFIAEPGKKILKADYSQIELRIVASLANDKIMLHAFENKVDIHTQTAAAINEVDIKDVTPAMRRAAKEVNFGVLYGMGAWGLAQRTGVSAPKAQEFITHYFAAYKSVRKYIDETIAMAREKGYVETFYGRRRYIPEINSGVQQVRSSAERMATNTPVQGSAADLIKLAMIEIHQELPKTSPDTKMILQVHDELVFEVPEKEVTKVAEFIHDAMCRVYKLRAPIEAEVSVGNNWGETEKISL